MSPVHCALDIKCLYGHLQAEKDVLAVAMPCQYFQRMNLYLMLMCL